MTIKPSHKRTYKVSTAASRRRRRRNKVHFAHFLLQTHIWHRVKYYQQYTRVVRRIEQKLYAEQQWQTAREEKALSNALALPFRGRQRNESNPQWREPTKDRMSGHLTDSDEERSEPINDLIKQFCPDHADSCPEISPPLECCAMWRRFQKVWSEYSPSDPDDKTTQEDLTFMVHCMWRWPFEMWESDDDDDTRGRD